MSGHVRLSCDSIYTDRRNERFKVFLLRKMSGSRVSRLCCCFRLRRWPSGCRTLKRPSTLFLKTNSSQRRNLAVYFMVMLLPYQNQEQKPWKPSCNRYYGAYGLHCSGQLIPRSGQRISCFVPGSTPGVPILLYGDTPPPIYLQKCSILIGHFVLKR